MNKQGDKMSFLCEENNKEYYREYYATHREACTKAARKYYTTHKEVCQARSKTYKQECKKKVFCHYSRGRPTCACCGETELKFLTIDHINRDGAEHTRQLGIHNGASVYIWLIRNKYPEGFQVLCYNCNCGREYNHGICPHKEINTEGDKIWHLG